MMTAFSQRVYFVYLQSENGQAFSVKLGNTLHYASAAGYLILSQLKDDNYKISISFPGDDPGELRFTIPVRGNDRGFLVRDFGGKGWGLYDLQTSAVIMAEPDPVKMAIRTEPREVSAFTRMLARAADDPSLLVRQVLPQEIAVREEKKSPAREEKKSETETPKTPPADEIGIVQTRTTAAEQNTNTEPVTGKPQGTGSTPDDQREREGVARVPAETVIPGKNGGTLATPIDTVVAKTGGEKEKVGEPLVKAPEAKPVAELKKTEEGEAISLKDTSVTVVPSGKVQEKAEEKMEGNERELAVKEPLLTVEEKKEKRQDEKTIPPSSEKMEEKKQEVRPYRRSVVTRRSESSTTEGFGLTFTDEYSDGSVDTIRIIIPTPKYNLMRTAPGQREEKKFLDITSEGGELKNAAREDQGPRKNECSALASENDFLRLRKRMASERSDDGMISEARRVFRSKCFTVEQIRNLGALFLEDGGRYRFFDASYTHVSDLENFPTLEKELKDAYYLGRFREVMK